MAIRLTDELKAEALAVAQLYEPLREPLLVGSCVWLGEGHDIDVVVRVKDAGKNCGGDACSSKVYGDMVAYRHNHVNVIAVADEHMWNGWVYAAEAMLTMPKELIKAKPLRVAACEELRKIGEKQCQFD